MRIAFVIARVGDDKNVIQKLSLILADELRKQGDFVDVFPFKRKTLFSFRSYKRFKHYDCVLVANVGLQCAYYSLYKRFGLIKKPFAAISFGSDIRATKNKWINIFNKLSRTAVDLLIVINPDLESRARERGYRNIKYVCSWAGELS